MNKKWIADGGWSANEGWTMTAYSRICTDGKEQIIIQLPNKSGWRLLIDGQERARDKSIHKVLAMSNVQTHIFERSENNVQ